MGGTAGHPIAAEPGAGANREAAERLDPDASRQNGKCTYYSIRSVAVAHPPEGWSHETASTEDLFARLSEILDSLV
jgi:hypothetical protein